ncbi:hypothetical protein NUU61_007125 [Penicillium alfredii]|uniref:Methyltransferase domain-containing protein n=1 Tax=Penicillium alfredii TaxID=1506179 RepID=A0A9W9F279_9EURO|nr:uncharacterized protein NUU61_007125 [Penicillium alfredii]KAJ5092255.1 hypothetical protein NUU61_007125 [Penicillium alfredii]
MNCVGYVNARSAIATKLARRLAVACKQDATLPGKARPLRVIDLCTGTGCIALLLHALLAPHFEQLSVRGLDISPTALELAQKNLAYNLQRGLLTRRASTDVHFSLADVLGQGDASVPVVEEVLRNCLSRPNMFEDPSPDLGCDVLISNPPYISPSAFRDGTTARSVRRFEPKLALVPPLVDSVDSEGLAGGRPEDIFYHRLITLSFRLRAKVTVLECGDIAQANRVVAMHQAIASGQADASSAEVWPITEQELLANGFHPHDGSRCVVIQRQSHER